MEKERIYNFYENHKGEIIGAAIGALFAVLVIIIGFWRTTFIGLCTFIGYYIGRKFSNKDELINLLDRILPPGRM